MKILALSGSLRSGSINSALLRAAARLAPPTLAVTVFSRLAELPPFNPEHEADPPAAVAAFRSQVADADALLIASPEYAHGISGTIKNALDWLVSFEPFAGKPIAVLNASPRARHADAALREILATMAADIIEPACIAIPLLGANLDEEGMLATPSVAAAIRQALSALCDALASSRPSITALNIRCAFRAKSWSETPFHEMAGAGKLSRASIENILSGELEGNGVLEYLLAYPNTEGLDVRFTGYERIVGKTGGLEGSFSVKHDGVFSPSSGVAGTLEIVPHSGTGDFAGVKGGGTISARKGEHGGEYQLAVRLP